MAWRRIGSGRYYYAWHREGGRVRSTYLPDRLAELHAQLVAERRHECELRRQAMESTRESADRIEVATRDFRVAAHQLGGLLLVASGYHRCYPYRSRWRKSMGTGRGLAALPKLTTEQLLERAARGDESVAEQALALLQDPDQSDWLVGSLFNLSNLCKNHLVNRAAGANYLMAEALMENLNLLARKVAGPDPTVAERLLAERVAISHFVVTHHELRAALPGQTTQQVEYETRLLNAAHKRFLLAMETLARVRRLALPVLQAQVNVGLAQQINPPPGPLAPG